MALIDQIQPQSDVVQYTLYRLHEGKHRWLCSWLYVDGGPKNCTSLSGTSQTEVESEDKV